MSSAHDLGGLASPALGSQTKFPAVPYAGAGSYFGAYVEESERAVSSIERVTLDRAASVLLEAHLRGACIFSCGNGGSAAIANHLQCDHSKGVRSTTDLAPRVVSLSSNIELITAIANDTAYEDVFAYQLQSQSRPGDVLIAISSSGRSPNIVRALEWARGHDLRTVALTGFDGGDAKLIAEIAIHVDCTNYGIVEDVHQGVMHVLAQFIRQSRMTPDAISASTF